MSNITPTARVKKARDIFSGPYNCAQAVACAFSDVVGLEDEKIMRLVSGFGFGMGGERSVCGAISGGIFVLSSTLPDPASRDELYADVRDLLDRFRQQHGNTIMCRDLVGENPGHEDFQSSCPPLIESVIKLVSEKLAGKRK